MNQLRIAIVGAGARAQHHLGTLDLLRDYYRVVGVCDLQMARATAAAARFDALAFSEPLQMLDEVHPDALFIIIPPDGHHPLAAAAAERRIHVLCETPISIALPLADLMISACERAGVVLEICENVPRWPRERIKREVVQRGLLGEIILARLQYASGGYHGISAVRRLIPGQATRAWGFRQILPSLPQREYTRLLQDTQEWEFGYFSFQQSPVEPQSARSGHSVTLLFEQPPRPGARNSWEIIGKLGRVTDSEVHLVSEEPNGKRGEVSYPISYETGPGRAIPTNAAESPQTLVRAVVATDPPVVWENPYANLGLPASPDDVASASQLLTFHRAITEGGAPEYGAREARTDLELLVALRESARQDSKPVDLPLNAVTAYEQALFEEYRLTYGCDPFAPTEETISAFFPSGGITHRLTHERIGEVVPRGQLRKRG